MKEKVLNSGTYFFSFIYYSSGGNIDWRTFISALNNIVKYILGMKTGSSSPSQTPQSTWHTTPLLTSCKVTPSAETETTTCLRSAPSRCRTRCGTTFFSRKRQFPETVAFQKINWMRCEMSSNTGIQ